MPAKFKRVRGSFDGLEHFAANLHNELTPMLEAAGTTHVSSRNETTQHWRTKPAFVKEVKRVTSTRWRLEVRIGGDEKEVKIWRLWLGKGTDVRHAVMSPDFQRKTHPNSTKTTAGGGNADPVFISKRLQLPGIKARNFNPLINKRLKPGDKVRVRRATLKALRRKR